MSDALNPPKPRHGVLCHRRMLASRTSRPSRTITAAGWRAPAAAVRHRYRLGPSGPGDGNADVTKLEVRVNRGGDRSRGSPHRGAAQGLHRPQRLADPIRPAWQKQRSGNAPGTPLIADPNSPSMMARISRSTSSSRSFLHQGNDAVLRAEDDYDAPTRSRPIDCSIPSRCSSC